MALTRSSKAGLRRLGYEFLAYTDGSFAIVHDRSGFLAGLTSSTQPEALREAWDLVQKRAGTFKDEPELKLCPCCGKSAKVGTINLISFVQCKKCGLKVERWVINSRNKTRAEAMCVRVWNKRV